MAIDRTSKCAFVEPHQEAGKMIAAQFLCNLIVTVLYIIYAILTDDPVSSDVERSIQLTHHAHKKHAFHHMFGRVCDENGVE